mgnify:CR=1 FL=1
MPAATNDTNIMLVFIILIVDCLTSEILRLEHLPLLNASAPERLRYLKEMKIDSMFFPVTFASPLQLNR